MVMHARKLPRISDGFIEKHQTHSYENSKYSSSKYRYSNHEKSRDSPSTNSLRSSSPDSRSQSPRYHKVAARNLPMTSQEADTLHHSLPLPDAQTISTHLSWPYRSETGDKLSGKARLSCCTQKGASYYKVREKERDRDRDTRDRDRDRERDRERDRDRDRDRDRERDRERDYHYRDRDDSRSPKERRRDVRDRDRDRERDRDSRGNHDRINSVHKKEEKERLARVGDWSEHVSSSGKKYYYNCRTEVSQWEKPPEWLEWERTRAKETSNRSHDKSSTRQDKHSNLGESYREGRDIRDSERERNDRDRREVYRGDDMYDRRDTRKYGQDVGAADMDISSGDSTPTSEHLHARGTTTENSHDVSGATVSLATTSGATVTSTHSGTTTTHLQSGLRPKLGLLPGSLPSSLPLLSSNAVASTSGNNTTTTTSLASSLPALGGSTSMAVPQLLNLHPRLMTLPNSMNKSGIDMDMKSVNCNNSHTHDGEGMLVKSQLEPLTISASSNNIGGGPPTPTHSENQDCIDIRKAFYISVGSPTSSINSLQSLTQTAGGSLAGLRPLVPALTPSLANYYKESLITHVQNWPAEALEKPAQRLSEEAHSVGSLVMTRVSAELKMARSLVRLAEIQATLHEQRILFLRAQKRELEEMKAQNSFMSDT